jgi:hypothetical protein
MNEHFTNASSAVFSRKRCRLCVLLRLLPSSKYESSLLHCSESKKTSPLAYLSVDVCRGKGTSNRKI